VVLSNRLSVPSSYRLSVLQQLLHVQPPPPLQQPREVERAAAAAAWRPGGCRAAGTRQSRRAVGRASIPT